MTIWADADSLPPEARRLIARRAGSAGSVAKDTPRAVFVANRPQPLPPGPNLFMVIVGVVGAQPKPSGQAAAAAIEDANPAATADDYILSAAKPGDVVVTRDIPLAAKAIERGIVALNDRGTVWTTDAVRERRSLRDHMAALREQGLAPGSPRGRSYGQKEARAFADALDKAIAQALRLA